MRSRYFSIFSFLLLLAPLFACGTELPKKRVVFFFCDVTNSLNKTESETVAQLTAQMINKLQPGTEYKIFPILVETERLAPLNNSETKIPVDDDNRIKKSKQEDRQKEIKEKLANLYRVTNVANKNDNRTCILNALVFASNQFSNYSSQEYDRDLVIVSDMLEECDGTPLGKPIDIRKDDISEEIRQTSNFPKNIDFSQVRVNIVVPATEQTYIDFKPGTKPSMLSLQEFWLNIFKRCNIGDDALKDPKKFYWSNGDIPRQFP